jgi:hypothetical protein
MATGLVTTAGKTLRAQMLAGDQLPGLSWIAVGQGTWGDKLNPPAETAEATALADEIARKQVSQILYLGEDVTGEIIFQGKTYIEIPGPGPIVAFVARFTESEIVGAQICEEGVFGDTVVTSASPLALPGEVSVPGVLYWIRNRPLVVKGANDTYEVMAIFEER